MMRAFIWAVIIIILVIVGILVSKRKPADVTAVQPTQPAAENQQQPVTSTPEPQQSAPAATTTKNGMKIETVKQGTGPEIKVGQTAVMQYEGRLADGSVFDSTARHNNEPFSFTLGSGQVIQGWEQGVLGMKVGETRLLTIPPELGYGAAGYPPVIPQNATLTFTVTLVAIK